MSASTIVDKADMWLSMGQNWFGLCLPFRQRLLFAIMLNQYKLAVALNTVTLLISVAVALGARRLAGPLANLLLLWALFAYFHIDKKDGRILKMSSKHFQDVLYLVAIIGGLHVKRHMHMATCPFARRFA